VGLEQRIGQGDLLMKRLITGGLAAQFWHSLTKTGKAIVIGGAALFMLLTVIGVAATARDERSYHEGYEWGYEWGDCIEIRTILRNSSDHDQYDEQDMMDGCIAGEKAAGRR
jgi:hypothetical protein